MHLQRLVDLRFQARWLASLCCGLIIAASGGCSPRFKCAQTTPPDTAAVAALSAGIKPTGQIEYDPQDVQIAIDPASSTVCYEYFGEGWQSAVFGTIDMTLQPDCTSPVCRLTMSKIELSADDFVSNGHAISEVEIWGQTMTTALWTNDDTFAVPYLSTNIYIGYKDNGEIGGRNDINTFPLSWGTLDPDYQRFCWQGAIVRGGFLTANFKLCGHPVARPPVPVLTPTGIFQQDSAEGAHITFSSAQSHDPDNDISNYMWSIDNHFEASNTNSLATVLSVGEHVVAVTALDSRGVRKTATGSIIVQRSASF